MMLIRGYWAASFVVLLDCQCEDSRGRWSHPQKPRGAWKSSVASLKGSSTFPNRDVLGCQDDQEATRHSTIRVFVFFSSRAGFLCHRHFTMMSDPR